MLAWVSCFRLLHPGSLLSRRSSATSTHPEEFWRMKQPEMGSVTRFGPWAAQAFPISNSPLRRPRGTPITKEYIYALSPVPDVPIPLRRGTTAVENESPFFHDRFFEFLQ